MDEDEMVRREMKCPADMFTTSRQSDIIDLTTKLLSVFPVHLCVLLSTTCPTDLRDTGPLHGHAGRETRDTRNTGRSLAKLATS